MEAAIGDAAEQLARHDLDQHNPTQATWAARRSLLASPYDEPLYRQLMRAGNPAGNPRRRGHHRARALQVLDAEDQPLDDLHPDTIALNKKLLSTRSLRTRTIRAR